MAELVYGSGLTEAPQIRRGEPTSYKHKKTGTPGFTGSSPVCLLAGQKWPVFLCPKHNTKINLFILIQLVYFASVKNSLHSVFWVWPRP